MAAHGGRFANYYSKDTVTHIVCDNLPDTKLKQMLKSRSALPVVQAAWVVHSIAAGKLLPPSHFSIDRLAMAPAQQQLKPFAPRAPVTLDKADIYGQLSAAHPTNPAPPPPNTTAQHPHPTVVHEPPRPPACPSTPPDAPRQPSAASPRPQPGTTSTAGPHPQYAAPPRHSTAPTESPSRNRSAAASPARPLGHPAPPGRLVPVDSAAPPLQATWAPEQIAAAQRTAQAMRAACDVLKGPPKSSADDPKFLETYFRASRLHFIGTWRMRIEQLVRTESSLPRTVPAPLPPPPAAAATERCRPAAAPPTCACPSPPQAPPCVCSTRKCALHPGCLPGFASLSVRWVRGDRMGQHVCRVIMHVDMDCFFASVAVRNRPELQGIPLAVAHSNHSAGHSEISCVNYVARRCGVRADMWMASARERCAPAPHIVPAHHCSHNQCRAPEREDHAAAAPPHRHCRKALLHVPWLCTGQRSLRRPRAAPSTEAGCERPPNSRSGYVVKARGTEGIHWILSSGRSAAARGVQSGGGGVQVPGPRRRAVRVRGVP